MCPKSVVKPVKILIVEDFHVETGMIQRELNDAEFNYDSAVASTETEYKKVLRAYEPDVILSPYSLVTTNAVKLLSIARSEGFEMPFILLAFDLSEDIAIDLLAEGVDDYVQRSTLKRLPVAIKKALQRHKTQVELAKSQELLALGEEISNSGSFELDLTNKKHVGPKTFIASQALTRTRKSRRLFFCLTYTRMIVDITKTCFAQS